MTTQLKNKEILYNDFVIRFANVNGSGSASANGMFAHAIYRMGVPVTGRNIFPSNIQGLPTWFEVRVNERNLLGRRQGADIVVAMNAESYAQDVDSLLPGGYLVYDSSKPMARSLRGRRNEVRRIGIPISRLLVHEFADPKQRQLFKNIVYLGVLAELMEIEMDVLKHMVDDQYKGKDTLIQPNYHALDIGSSYAREYIDEPVRFRVRRSDTVGNRIMVDGNTAAALGALYGGATICAWYPITPSTSMAEAFEKYAAGYRKDGETGKAKAATVQAEDELSAIGIVIGAGWNGARAFTCTSGPGVSLMNEFLGLAYFAEIPAVLFDVQRAGPSTGMPTRTQQGDLVLSVYASHGDTKHVVLLPGTPKECFDFSADSFDLADRLQTPVLVLSDLDLGMNDHLSEPFEWEEGRCYDRGKVLSSEDLDRMDQFSRYLDVDGDGIGYRTLPGVHPSRGAFLTRGTSRDEHATYTESPEAYIRNMERLLVKWDTAKTLVPRACIESSGNELGVIYYGSTEAAMAEALEMLAGHGIQLDAMRIRAVPFGDEVERFIVEHETLFVVEQNRDGQMRQLLIAECGNRGAVPSKLHSVLYFGGLAISAVEIFDQILSWMEEQMRERMRPRVLRFS